MTPSGKQEMEEKIDITVSTSTPEDGYRERERLTIYHNVNHYVSTMAYIAHWLTPNGSGAFIASAIGAEMPSAGLQSHPPKHPDQRFWKQKSLTKMPSTDSVIVTDCKLLPCSDGYASCQYKVPELVGEKFGKGIPMAVFAHNDYNSSSPGKTKWCYYTASGATVNEIDQHIATTLGVWAWK